MRASDGHIVHRAGRLLSHWRQGWFGQVTSEPYGVAQLTCGNVRKRTQGECYDINVKELEIDNLSRRSACAVAAGIGQPSGGRRRGAHFGHGGHVATAPERQSSWRSTSAGSMVRARATARATARAMALVMAMAMVRRAIPTRWRLPGCFARRRLVLPPATQRQSGLHRCQGSSPSTPRPRLRRCWRWGNSPAIVQLQLRLH